MSKLKTVAQHNADLMFKSSNTLMQRNTVIMFSSNNCLMLSGMYVNKYSKFIYICQCGELDEIHPNSFKKGRRCGLCTKSVFIEDLERRLTLLSNLASIELEGVLTYKCKCGESRVLPHIHDKVFNNYVCPKCDIRNSRNTTEYLAWKKAVLIKYNYACQKCDSTIQPCAHHILSRQSYPSLQHDVSNGIVLCKTCHDRFHLLFSNQTNKEQLDLFITLCG